MSARRIEEAAAILVQARRSGTPFPGFPKDVAPRDEREAYEIQAAVYAELAGGEPIAGHKIGCTTPVMQGYLGIDHPCAGVVLASTVHRSPATVSCAGSRRLGVECELAVRLGSELELTAVMAAIEIVEDRYVDFRALDARALIADGFFGAGCVLGRELEPAVAGDLRRARASLTVGGVEVGRGEGGHILGDPLAALRWLREAKASEGRPLRPGELVLLGSVVETRWVGPGDEVVVESDPLGEVRVTFLP